MSMFKTSSRWMHYFSTRVSHCRGRDVLVEMSGQRCLSLSYLITSNVVFRSQKCFSSPAMFHAFASVEAIMVRRRLKPQVAKSERLCAWHCSCFHEGGRTESLLRWMVATQPSCHDPCNRFKEIAAVVQHKRARVTKMTCFGPVMVVWLQKFFFFKLRGAQ